MTRPKFWLGFGILGILGILLLTLFFFPRQKRTNLESAELVKQGSGGFNSSQMLIERVKEAPGLESSRLSESEKSGECKGTIESIQTLSLKTLAFDLAAGNLKLTTDCLPVSGTNEIFLKGFPAVCEKRENGQATAECLQKLLFYKALRIHHDTINDSLDGLSTEIIIQKWIGLMVDMAPASKSGLQMMKAVGQKLLERLPNSASAMKAALIGDFIDEELPAEQKRLLSAKIHEARELYPDNWDIYEMDLIRQREENPEGFRRSVNDFNQKNPNSPIGNYYVGCLAWSEGNQAKARQYFQRATELSPQDNRFMDTLKKSTASKPEEKVCTVQVSFSPDSF